MCLPMAIFGGCCENRVAEERMRVKGRRKSKKGGGGGGEHSEYCKHLLYINSVNKVTTTRFHCARVYGAPSASYVCACAFACAFVCVCVCVCVGLCVTTYERLYGAIAPDSRDIITCEPGKKKGEDDLKIFGGDRY